MLGTIRVRGLDAVTTHVFEQEARLYSKAQDRALFVTKKEAGKHGNDGKANRDKEGTREKNEKTHKRAKC